MSWFFNCFHWFLMVFHCLLMVFHCFFKELDFKELNFKELGPFLLGPMGPGPFRALPGPIGPHGVTPPLAWRCLLCFLTPGGVPATTTETFCNSWKIHGKSIHGKSNGKSMEKSMGNPWIILGKSMDNPWRIKTEKKGNVSVVLHGSP